MEWISVKDRLPEVAVQVLTYYEDEIWGNGMRIDVIGIGKDKVFRAANTFGQKVTHWMPLPEPPET